jgi:hypothetical protein
MALPVFKALTAAVTTASNRFPSCDRHTTSTYTTHTYLAGSMTREWSVRRPDLCISR